MFTVIVVLVLQLEMLQVFADIGMNYAASGLSELISANGEPGVCWLENMRRYSDQPSVRSL